MDLASGMSSAAELDALFPHEADDDDDFDELMQDIVED